MYTHLLSLGMKNNYSTHYLNAKRGCSHALSVNRICMMQLKSIRTGQKQPLIIIIVQNYL